MSQAEEFKEAEEEPPGCLKLCNSGGFSCSVTSFRAVFSKICHDFRAQWKNNSFWEEMIFKAL